MAEKNQDGVTAEQPSQPLAQPSSGPKTQWPELVGLTAEEAENKIKLEKPAVRVQVVPPDCFVTMDFNTGRVRLYLDASGKVARPPQVG